MADEIERKFLVDEPPDGLAAWSVTTIRQGYLVADGASEVRLRDRGGSHTLTFKRGTGAVREELEIELDETQFEVLWPGTRGWRLEKRRYVADRSGHRIELDVYEGDLEGLVTAEVEFSTPSEAAGFEPPGWFGREVTDDHRWANRRLAREGVPG